MKIADSLPLISVIMPVYNGERFLAGALHNVFAQNYHPLEVIVVDDGSTDGSAGIIAAFGEQIRYFHQPNAGPAVARNTGLALARGEVIAFLDVDDLWPPGKLHFQMQYLQQNPAFCRKAVFARVGGFDPTIRFGEDMDWFIRLREQQVVIEKLPTLGLLYRVRPGSMTYNKTLPEVGVFDIVRRIQQRRRASTVLANQR